MRSEGELHVQAMRLVCEALEDREENGLEVDWDVINQQLDHMDVILQGIADQRKDDAEQIQILKQERNAAEAKISKLRQELSADAVRQELEELKVKNFELLEKLATVEGAAATENESLRKQLADARAETIEARKRLNEETDRHRATNAEKIELFDQKEWANQHAAELVKERDAALAAVSLQRAGIERLRAFVGKVRAVVDHDRDGQEIDEMIEALGELDAETEPAIDANSSATLTGSAVKESLTPEPEEHQ